MTDYDKQAETLVEALRLRDVYAQHFVNEHGGTEDGVNVYASRGDRYPAHTVWVDHDGYTWGHSFEHNRTPLVGPADVAQAIIKTLPAADGPEKWVPEAIAEQEAYLEQQRTKRDA